MAALHLVLVPVAGVGDHDVGDLVDADGVQLAANGVEHRLDLHPADLAGERAVFRTVVAADGASRCRFRRGRQARGGRADRHHGRRRRRDGVREHRPRRGRHERHRVQQQGSAVQRPSGPRPRARSTRRAHQPPARAGHGRRATRRRRRLPRTVRSRCRLAGRRRNDGLGSGRLRHGQSHARGAARGRQRPRADHGHRALGLPQPDQQRARLPRCLPRLSTCAPQRSTRR
jgi:hypothetical protein